MYYTLAKTYMRSWLWNWGGNLCGSIRRQGIFSRHVTFLIGIVDSDVRCAYALTFVKLGGQYHCEIRFGTGA